MKSLGAVESFLLSIGIRVYYSDVSCTVQNLGHIGDCMKTKTSDDLRKEIRTTKANLRRIRGDLAFYPDKFDWNMNQFKTQTQVLNMLRATLKERGQRE